MGKLLQGLLLASMLLAGCSGTKVNVKSSYQPVPDTKLSYVLSAQLIPIDERKILSQHLDNVLRDARLLAHPSEQVTREVEISVVSYQMRPDVLRFMVGIFAGPDKILSQVTVKDASSKEVVGRFQVETSHVNTLATSKGLIEQHADELAAYLRFGGA